MEVTRWREFSSSKRTSQLGGKMAGLHAIDRAGYIVLGDGGFAQLSSSMVHTNSPEGKAFYQGFAMYDFPDGSSILAKVDVSGDQHGKQVGTITFVAGTGRFKGITGRGTIASWMPAEWDMYAEIEASFSAAGQVSRPELTAVVWAQMPQCHCRTQPAACRHDRQRPQSSDLPWQVPPRQDRYENRSGYHQGQARTPPIAQASAVRASTGSTAR